MSVVMDRIRQAAAKAASGPLADARNRPIFERVAAQSPFPAEACLEDYVERFRIELENLGASVYGPLDAKSTIDQVVHLIQKTTERAESEQSVEIDRPETEPGSQQSMPVLSWAESEIGCPGLMERLRSIYIDLVTGCVPNDIQHQVVLEKLARLEVGITGAVAGLADTGSIIVSSGRGRARIASLLPPVHLAILPVDRIYPTMHDWLLAGGAELVAKAANVVVITGSSRTSDIEMQLTLGMHGPRELHVVLMR